LRSLCWWGRSLLHHLLAPLPSRIEHIGACILLRRFFFGPVYYDPTALSGRAFWALACLRAPGPLFRLVGGDWTLTNSCSCSGIMVLLDIAPLHDPWRWLHALRMLDSRR
jgi:hypothetical protein